MHNARNFARRTKIVCTIGPASGSAANIEQLIRAGMNVARLNLSHGTSTEHAGYIRTVRKLARRLQTPVAILVDLPGPKYRTGSLSEGSAVLRKGNPLVLTTRQVEGDARLVSVNYPTLPLDVEVGNTVLVDDGAIQLRVISVSDTDVKCRVIVGGLLTPGRGVVVPGMQMSGPYVTEAMQQHIDFAIHQKPDYIALSFVTRADDVEQTKALLHGANCDIPIIVKIERGRAVSDFDLLLAVSDGAMVARGDLGIDIPLQRVPWVQKEIIRKCNQEGKPVITATQMLESMIKAPRPTRAEVADVANAILDGTDATMLSAETSVGKYPVQAVRMMARIARETERRLPYDRLLSERGSWPQPQTDEMIAYDACQTAHRLDAAAIVAFTSSGSTARRVSKYRPRMPILALTPSKTVFGSLLLCWGVRPVLIAEAASVDELFATGVRLAKEAGLAKPGDLVVVTGGTPIGMPGTTNLLKVEQVE